MAIKYELQDINNASGSGKKRKFVRLRQLPAMKADQLEHEIEANTTLKRADVKAVMAELSAGIVRQLSGGHRFYLPEIGYLSLGVALKPDEEAPTATDISIRTLRFRPEQKLLKAVRESTRFEKAAGSTRSANYTEKELWPKVAEYLSRNHYIRLCDMCREFHLHKNKAKLWLNRFAGSGLLVKEGSALRPLYFRSEQA